MENVGAWRLGGGRWGEGILPQLNDHTNSDKYMRMLMETVTGRKGNSYIYYTITLNL